MHVDILLINIAILLTFWASARSHLKNSR